MRKVIIVSILLLAQGCAMYPYTYEYRPYYRSYPYSYVYIPPYRYEHRQWHSHRHWD